MEKAIFDEMIETRRRIHRIPEEGWTEFETTHLVAERLKALGYVDIRLGTDIIDPASVLGRDAALVEKEGARAVEDGVPAEFIERTGGYTGCAAVLDTGREGPVTAFRFDMDALRVEESDDPEHLPAKLGFASERKGLMHACGHDSHTAIGLAVARFVAEHADDLRGVIKLIFQPAEEGVRGAAAIAGSGFLDDVDLILASHCGGKYGPGEVGLVHGGMLASTKYDIYFTGTPSHAGNAPHKGRSALMAACATAMMMAGIPRHGEGASRVAVGRLVAGEGRNITPVHAMMQAEVRGETAEVNDYMCEAVKRIVEGNAHAYGVEARIERAGEATTIVDCPDVLDILRDIARDVPGVKDVSDTSSPSASEDYTIMLRRVTERGGRGAFFYWGCSHRGHHRGDFDIQDTETMPIAFEVFARFALRMNGWEDRA